MGTRQAVAKQWRKCFIVFFPVYWFHSEDVLAQQRNCVSCSHLRWSIGGCLVKSWTNFTHHSVVSKVSKPQKFLKCLIAQSSTFRQHIYKGNYILQFNATYSGHGCNFEIFRRLFSLVFKKSFCVFLLVFSFQSPWLHRKASLQQRVVSSSRRPCSLKSERSCLTPWTTVGRGSKTRPQFLGW